MYYKTKISYKYLLLVQQIVTTNLSNSSHIQITKTKLYFTFFRELQARSSYDIYGICTAGYDAKNIQHNASVLLMYELLSIN